MTVLKFTTLLALSLVVFSISAEQTYPTYAQYVGMFGKNYSTTEQYAKHEKAYNDRIAGFSNVTDYKPGINRMTDWLPEQIDELRKLNKVENSARLSKPLQLSSSRLGYPVSLDWRNSGAVTSVKDQGSCGACWAFASVAYVQSKLIIQGRFTASNIDLSEQYLASCTPQSSCAGGYFQRAMVKALSLPAERTYPYSPYSSQPAGICTADGVKPATSNVDYYSLSDSELIGLLQTGPVAISIDSTGWENYGSGTFSCGLNSQVNHAVLLVGYTADYWIVKNQWNENWGMNGYIRVTRNRNNNCAIGYSAHIMLGAGDRTNDQYYASDYNNTNPTPSPTPTPTPTPTPSTNTNSTKTVSESFNMVLLPILVFLILLSY